jgi:aryl sulfotransferase
VVSDNVQEISADGPPEEGGIPWIDPTMQQEVRWRDGDIVISVPAKSGTTWTMNIVHQLRSGGDPDFADVYAEVPWLEFVTSPTADRAELVAAFERLPHDRRRAFKSHSAPPDLPYVDPGSGTDVRYVVTVRNPDEAVASMRPFIAAHSNAWFDLWQIPKGEIVGPDLPTFFEHMGPMLVGGIFGFIAAWWPLRHQPNVHLVHFNDLKREPEASVRSIADFLGFDPTEEQWAEVLEYTSFAWMKAHEDKFEIRTICEVPPLDSGAMIRKGKIGASADDGVTPEMSAAIRATGSEIVANPLALTWCYQGGPLPE